MSTDLETSEGDILSILGDDERPSRVLLIQHSSELADRQILVANVLDSGDDPDFGHGRDRVGGSREGNLKTTGGASSGLSVSADGRKTESEERQREHSDAGESKGSSNWIETRCPSTPQHPILFIPLRTRKTRLQRCRKTRQGALTSTRSLMATGCTILSQISSVPKG